MRTDVMESLDIGGGGGGGTGYSVVTQTVSSWRQKRYYGAI